MLRDNKIIIECALSKEKDECGRMGGPAICNLIKKYEIIILEFIVIIIQRVPSIIQNFVLTITGALNRGELSATIFFTESGSLPTV